MAKRVLFVCSRNRWRSPTAEDVYRGTPGLEVASCGTSASAVRRASARLLEWADVVVCMEGKHRDRLREQFGRESLAGKEEVVLEVEDVYRRGDEGLVAELREGLAGVL